MNRAPLTDRIWIADWPKSRNAAALSPAAQRHLAGRGLFLDTCLRQMWIVAEPGAAPPAFLSDPGIRRPEVRSGSDAYRYALEVTTGLRSSIPGETNVFGQFKKAWNRYRSEARADSLNRLAPFVHRLINDTRAIRTAHLQGIGGASYGTLVRLLLSPRKGDRLLLVGAGDLARSLLPYFSGLTVGLWNHRAIPVRGPADEKIPGVDLLFAPDTAADAAGWADHVVLTTTPVRSHDDAWRTRLANAGARTVVHLGLRAGDPESWPGCARFFVLDDVFELRRRQASLRSRRLDGARAACRDAARELLTDREPAAAGIVVPV